MSRPVRYHLDGFPPTNIDWERLVPLIGRATAALARYDGLVSTMPNADVLLSPLTTQEAVLSSKIEGINLTMSEMLEIEAGADSDVDQPKRDDAEEIVNYRAAFGFAADTLQYRPLSLHLLREAHAHLMRGVRGRDKAPGTFRDAQNWIGRRGCTIAQASFVPIPQQHLQTGLERWMSYVQSRTELDPLVQLAIIHLEFEALHPFKDGNGRLGRMIIPLFLYEQKVLSRPNFYMSGYLEAHCEQYVEAMQAVSREGAWTDWCAFFLEGLIQQASENRKKAQSIIDLHVRMQRAVADLTRSQFSAQVVDFIFSRPVFSSRHFVDATGIPRETALRLLRILRDAALLLTIREGAGRRAAILVFPEILSIAEARELLWSRVELYAT